MTEMTIPTQKQVSPLGILNSGQNSEGDTQLDKYRLVAKGITMEAEYLHAGKREVEYMLGKVKEELTEPNISYVLKYVEHMQIEAKDPKTIARHLQELRFILGRLKKDAKQACKEDLEKIVLAVNQSGKAAVSRKKTLLTLRVFYRWLYGTDEDPEIVKFVKKAIPKHLGDNKKTPQDMLTQEDIRMMVESADTQLEKTLVMFMASTGARVGEVLNVHISDLQLASDPNSLSLVKFDGKTGPRTSGILAEAVPYLKTYIENERKKAKPNEPLFVWKKSALDFKNVRYILGKLSSRAGIKKRVHSHLFRYYLSSYMASKGMQESQMSIYFGYSPQMASHYTKLADVNDTIARLNGQPIKETIRRDLLSSKTCPKCGAVNEFSNRLCSKCMKELDAGLPNQVERLQEELSDFKSAFNTLMEILPEEVRKKVANTLDKR